MASMNRATFSGFLGREAEVRHTAGGKEVTNFSSPRTGRKQYSQTIVAVSEIHDIVCNIYVIGIAIGVMCCNFRRLTGVGYIDHPQTAFTVSNKYEIA